MPQCTRRGCGREFSEASVERCTFHSGAPVFHEGLKSWSCCSDVYKPVMEFDEFMKIPPCTETERHTNEAPEVEAPKASASAFANLTMTETGSDGQEVYSSNIAPVSSQPIETVAPAVVRPTVVEEEDDLNIPVSAGTPCRRTACGVVFTSDDVNRIGNGEGTVCTYHPSPPIFREGSKGYLCCKRRVLEFDEFLKITGCKTGRHVFTPKIVNTETEEMTTCRIDHYQTLDRVHVSIFAKKADKERSQVKIESTQISFDLYLPGSKRFVKTVELFGPVDPDASSCSFFGTKVEVNLKKQDTRSWTILERSTQDLGNISLTFGVGGRTGTIGGKEIILDATNKAKLA
ncbi:chord-domain-containing protein [Mycena rebaudengoi]|nr:chord-domain-containing protein [Mycena rebaudengoi]